MGIDDFLANCSDELPPELVEEFNQMFSALLILYLTQKIVKTRMEKGVIYDQS